jgi:hypothetical protein
MAFKELPLNSRLLEQFDTELTSEAEGYNPNVQAMEFGDYETERVIGGVQASLGKYYTRPSSRLKFTFEPPTSYQGYGYTGNITFTIKKANSNFIVNYNSQTYADVLTALGGQFFTVDLSTHDISVGDVLIVELYYEVSMSEGDDTWEDYVPIYDIELNVVDETATEVGTIIYAPYVARILDINGNNIKVNQSWADFKNKLPNEIEGSEFEASPSNVFNDWSIGYKSNDKRDLYTYLHFGGDQMHLVTNIKTDNINFPKLPYSTVFKLYEPLPDDIEEKDKVHIVREILPQKTEVVELVGYNQEDEDVLVLKVPDSVQVDSPISKRTTELQNYSDLVTTDSKLQNEIVDKFISGSNNPADLNIDYTNFENFVNFSSAEKRLKNFKYKVQQIETHTAKSASYASTTNGANDALIYEDKIRNIKNNFDGYETYLYNVSSSYKSSSLGEFPDASWPKTGTGTYADPFKPISSSNTLFTTWYGSTKSQIGQIATASLYDNNNPNRLVNILPPHVKEDIGNNQFLDFMDMIGQHFDELWVYVKALADITDRQNDLTKGFSDDLIFNLAKSLGWDVQDGKDLLDLSRVGFGQKLSGTTYSLYTSGSLSSPPEGDISKEITKRLIGSMPYLLKSKGTVGALKGIINCYGIPSSILRVREYGGMDNSDKRPSFEISRKFTKVLGFSGSQYVETTWADDDNSNRKPDTVEFRFRAISGSDQILVQKDTQWAIKVKDNGSTDNYGTVSFMLSGSDGYKEISSSLLPVYDKDFYSVMLRKKKIDAELLSFPSFETGSLFNPPFITDGGNSAEGGSVKILSGSGIAKTGTNYLEHKNTRSGTDAAHVSYTYMYKSSSLSDYTSYKASVASVSQHERYTFSAYAKVSASAVDSLGQLVIFELDKNGDIVNWTEEQHYPNKDGGIKGSEQIGLNETEWKQLKVSKTIKFPNTTDIAIRFDNLKKGSTILWDDASLRKHAGNTDTILDPMDYSLYVKKYDAGLDRILHSSKTSLIISSSVSQSYNASWTGSGNLFIGGNSTTSFSAAKLSGSMMEFRLWTEPLKESRFDNHVSNPKSYIGNSVSSSYYNLVRRYSFDDNTTLSDGDSLRDVSSNQTYTKSGSARGFGGNNFFQSIVDRTKTMVPDFGPSRRLSSKIRLEENSLSGSGATLSKTDRWDISSNDLSPIDSPKLGIYFSPVDVINEDIISSFANLDFNQYIGDPRDNFEPEYRELRDISNEYFKKYSFGSGSANFWDYMHIIKYYDQSIFKQLKKLIPARAKPHLGTLIEGNIFERPKSPVQKNHPTLTQPYYEDTINITTLETHLEHEDSRSLVILETDPAQTYPNYDANINERLFREPSLYRFATNDNYEDRNLYISGSAKYGGPNYVFSEPTGAMALQNRISENNKEYKFFYTSSLEFDMSSRYTSDSYIHKYTSKSLHETDLDPEYDKILAWNRSFFEGVKNSIHTTPDGDLPIIVRTSAPTVAVPTDLGISKLKIDEAS